MAKRVQTAVDFPIEERIFKKYIDLDKMSRKEMNFKSKLIEWSQKNKMKVSFELIEQLLDKGTIRYSVLRCTSWGCQQVPAPVIPRKNRNKMPHRWH